MPCERKHLRKRFTPQLLVARKALNCTTQPPRSVNTICRTIHRGPVSRECHAEKELQGAARLVVQAQAYASLLDEPQQMLANLFAAKLIR
jgi:hypothetical protein